MCSRAVRRVPVQLINLKLRTDSIIKTPLADVEAASPFLVESPHPPLVATQPVSAPFRTMKEPAARTLVPDQSR
jgi:hypothetical protein